MAVVDLLAVARERGLDPEATILVTDPTSFTLAGLERGVDHDYVPTLRARGARAGRIFPVVVEPDEEGVLTLLALWRLGAVPAPLNPRLTGPERDQAGHALAGRDAGDAQVVLWTSGTSGAPRGVALSFANLAASAEAVSRRLQLTPRDVWLATLSPAHVGGLALLTRPFLLGGVLVAWGRVETTDLAALLDGPDGLPVGVGRAVSHVSLVPTQLRRLLDQWGDRPPPPALRCVLLGGAHTPPALLGRAVEAAWPVALTYGMTEMTSQVATAPPALAAQKAGTVGKALDGVEVRVAEDGEICTRGPTQALGYAAGAGSLGDEEGWFHTGDLGRLDADGDLWILGRAADRIITGGVNVDAVEVEDVIRSHPSVVDVCVVGLPDDEWGEVVSAWVVPVEGEFDLDEIETWLAELVGGPKRPRRWVVEREVPLNANGKPDRGLVRELIGG
jgi:O-succinylbenzoic acid--CoA ligase